MNDAIRAWLNGGRPYAAGFAIYQQCGHDAQLLQRLVTGESDSNKKALFSALKGLVATAIERPKAADAVPAVENAVSLEAKRSADRQYKGMMNLRAQLIAITPIEESPSDTDPEQKKLRGRLAKDIVLAKREVDDGYDEYRYALIHGILREKPAPVVTDDIDPLLLPGLISNLRKRLSKLRNGEQSDLVEKVIAEKNLLLTNYLQQYDRAKAGRSGTAQ